MTSVLLSSVEFCQLLGIEPKRLEHLRRLERTRPGFQLPVTPLGKGQHARFDAFDAIKLHAVLELERSGINFDFACKILMSSGVAGFLANSNGGDYIVATWQAPDGPRRFGSASALSISRMMPAHPLTAISVNLSACAETISSRAADQFGLGMRHVQFFREVAP